MGAAQEPAELVCIAAGGSGVPVARETATRQWAPRHDTDPLVDAEREHLTLTVPVEQVVVILHGGDAGPTMGVGSVERLGTRPGTP